MTKGFVANHVLELTGISAELIRKDLSSLAIEHGFDLANITLEEFRQLVTIYMQNTLIEAKNAMKHFG